MSKEDSKMRKVERLVVLFKPERYAYLIISAISCIVLIVFAVILFNQKKAETHFIIGMFGSSGVIAVAMGRMLKMWNDVIKFLFNTDEDESE